MNEIFFVFGRALKSLREPGMLWHMVWPSLAAILLWSLMAFFAWTPAKQAMLTWLGSSWIGHWLTGFSAIAAILPFIVSLLLIAVVFLLVYLTSIILLSVFALSMMLERVAAREYASLEQRHGGSNLGSIKNTAVATVGFVTVLLLSLPLWLIPGVGFVISVTLTAWLNQRTFGYDALMLHADSDEIRSLPRHLRKRMLTLGAICALLTYIPVLNLFAAAFCGITFIHFMLRSLERTRTTTQQRVSAA